MKVDANQLIARGAVSPPHHPPSRETFLERLFRHGRRHECPIQQINGVMLIETLVPSGIFLFFFVVALLRKHASPYIYTEQRRNEGEAALALHLPVGH